jgi:zinc protease
MDLRETKGWSYGVGGNPSIRPHSVSYVISAPVQADRTADALAALNGDVAEFLSTKGVSQDELTSNVANLVNGLPGDFETSGALLQAMMRNDLLGRPDDYYVGLPARYRAQTTASLDAAARSAIDPKGFTWVVVGDAAKLRPQLDKLGIPIDVIEAQ